MDRRLDKLNLIHHYPAAQAGGTFPLDGSSGCRVITLEPKFPSPQCGIPALRLLAQAPSGLDLELRGSMATGDSTMPRRRACVRACQPVESPSFRRLFCSPVEAQSTSQAQVYRCPRRGGHFSSTQGLEIDMEKQQFHGGRESLRVANY